MESGDVIAYDPERDVYRTNYETERLSPSLALVEAIAAIEETDPVDLEPIGNSIDMNAIDRIIHASNDDRETRITLSYQGYHVTISTAGVVELQPADSDTANPTTAD